MGREDYQSRGGKWTTAICAAALLLGASLLIATNAIAWVIVVRWLAR